MRISEVRQKERLSCTELADLRGLLDNPAGCMIRVASHYGSGQMIPLRGVSIR
jgi:hypothetical protein